MATDFAEAFCEIEPERSGFRRISRVAKEHRSIHPHGGYQGEEMNAQHLLEHFDHLIDTPDAVPRLRRFILDLAVRGKLVEQDPKDEPAGEMLRRITKEKTRLIKVGSLRQQKTQTLAKEDTPFDLPVGWKWTQLAEIGEVNPRCQEDDSAAASFVPMQMISAKYGQPHEHEVRQWGEIKKGFTQFAEGDVGLAKITPCFENGKSTVFRGLTGGLGAGTTELHVLRPVFVSADYILVFLKSSHFIETGIPKMTGTAGQKRVPREYFAFSPVPLPPLAKQHRIVAKVDELMALCDELEAMQTKREKRRDRLVTATLHGLNSSDTTPSPDAPSTFEENARFYFNHLPRLTTRPEHIHQLRQTILNLAVRGKLVPQNPKDEPVAILLKRVQPENDRLARGGRASRQEPVDQTGGKDQLSQLPAGWEWVKIEDTLLVDSRNGYSKKPDEAINGVPILRISAGTIRRDGIVAEEEHKLIGRITRELQEQYRLEPGDLLACRFNGNRDFVGRLSLFTGYLGLNPIYPDKLIRLRLSTSVVLPELVRWFAKSAAVREDIESYCATTVGNWGISAANLKQVRLPLPPLAEQRRIVVKLDELMALCSELEAGLVRADQHCRASLDASLAQIFASRPLVSQLQREVAHDF